MCVFQEQYKSNDAISPIHCVPSLYANQWNNQPNNSRTTKDRLYVGMPNYLLSIAYIWHKAASIEHPSRIEHYSNVIALEKYV